MTGRYAPRMPILGTTLGTYRKVLKGWVTSRDLRRMPRGLGLAAETIVLIVDDAEARGLVGRFGAGNAPSGEYGLSPGGKTLVTATTTPRMSPAVAHGLLGGILANAAAMNADRGNPVKVERIWLFGSLARDEADMGDVDIVIERRGPPDNDVAYQAYYERAIDLAYDLGGGYAVERAEYKGWAAVDFIEKRCLFGERKDPRVKNHPLYDLTNLACPCKLVFDSSRGGPVSDPLMARHPKAVGKQKVGVRGPMPDMSVAAPAVPTSIGLALDHALPTLNLPDRYCVAGHGMIPEGIEDQAGRELAPWMRGIPALDGRSTSIVTDRGRFGSGEPMVAVHLERSFTKGGGPGATVAGGASTGGDPEAHQVERLGLLLAETCMLDAAKMRLAGLGWREGAEVSLSVSGDAPSWVHGIVRVASLKLERDGISSAADTDPGLRSGPAAA